MKFGLVLMIVGFSSAGFACPNLQGNWHCVTDTKATADFAATQKDIPGGVAYTVTSDQGTQDVLVDGITRTAAAADGSLTTATWACTGDTGFTGVLHLDAADKSYSADGIMTYMMPDANSFNGKTEAVFHVPNKPDQTQNSSENCTRK